MQINNEFVISLNNLDQSQINGGGSIINERDNQADDFCGISLITGLSSVAHIRKRILSVILRYTFVPQLSSL